LRIKRRAQIEKTNIQATKVERATLESCRQQASMQEQAILEPIKDPT